MNLIYLSNGCFVDFDLAPISLLSQTYKITYVVIIEQGSNFTPIQIESALLLSKHPVNFISIKLHGRRRNILNFFILGKYLLKLKKSKFDIIYVQGFEDFYMSLYCILFGNRNKTIYGVHDAIPHSGWKNNAIFQFARNTPLRKYNNFLSFSKSQSRVLLNRFPKKRVFTIPLSQKDFGKAIIVNKNYDVINFLFFGNIAVYKGLDVLLKAVSNLAKNYSNFKLVIAGRCNDWENVYEPLITNTMRVEKHIRFIDADEIPEFFNNAHYLILPYRDVTQSGPLMTAYNFNIPVIASKLEGFEEFIETDISGYFFENENAVDLAKVLESTILKTKNEYLALQQRLSEFVEENYSDTHISKLYVNMFETIVAF